MQKTHKIEKNATFLGGLSVGDTIAVFSGWFLIYRLLSLVITNGLLVIVVSGGVGFFYMRFYVMVAEKLPPRLAENTLNYVGQGDVYLITNDSDVVPLIVDVAPVASKARAMRLEERPA